MNYIKLIFYSFVILSFASCGKEDPSEIPSLVIHFKFDSTQARLNNLGKPSTIDTGNAAQTPNFKSLKVHYVELSPFYYIQLGEGTVAYKSEEAFFSGENAIIFDKEATIDPTNNTLRIPFKNIKADEYEFIRISLGYQGYDINAVADLGLFGLGDIEFPISIASFLGFNTYVTSHKVKDSTIVLNRSKKQGYWAGEVHISNPFFKYDKVLEGQSPFTTVVNPLFTSSPIPSGSCVVTSKFLNKNLKIVENQLSDIHIEVSISTNKSFEWKDTRPNGKWDVYPNLEPVTDMGVRGIVSKITM